MVVPTDTTVTLDVTASDVIHSWWIPKLGGKVDGVPGHVNKTWFKIPRGKEGDVPRPVRRALRRRPRRHARARSARSRPTSSRAGRTQQREDIEDAGEALGEQRERARAEGATRASGSAAAAGAGPRSSCTARPSARAGWLAWLTTTDHKKIGILYLFATFLFFVIGGVEALIMRLQLAQPNGTLVDPETYNGLVTMHGTTMIFLFVVPVLAGFGNYFVPLMIGARDMAFPRLNALSFWLLALRRHRLLHERLLRAAAGRLDLLRAAVRRQLLARAAAWTPGSS